jgi:hypothetical protein
LYAVQNLTIVCGLSECAKHVRDNRLENVMPHFAHRVPASPGDALTLLDEALQSTGVVVESVDETLETFDEAFLRLSQRHVGDDPVLLVTHREGVRDLVRAHGPPVEDVRSVTPYCCVALYRVAPASDDGGVVTPVFGPVAPTALAASLPLPPSKREDASVVSPRNDACVIASGDVPAVLDGDVCRVRDVGVACRPQRVMPRQHSA